MKNQYRFLPPPAPVQAAKLDNLALVPGNLLPMKATYQKLANKLPAGGVLIVTSQNKTHRDASVALARTLSRQGKAVRLMSI
jgi:hypothetical protein